LPSIATGEGVTRFSRRGGADVLDTEKGEFRVGLLWRRKSYRPLDKLELVVSVTNSSSQTLEGAEMEMLLEVEKGVFYTWRLRLKPIPPRSTVEDAVKSILPHSHIYENVTVGRGNVYLKIRDQEGRLLLQDHDEIEIVE